MIDTIKRIEMSNTVIEFTYDYKLKKYTVTHWHKGLKYSKDYFKKLYAINYIAKLEYKLSKAN